MFGFKKKTVPAELSPKVIAIANEAYGGLAGLLEDDHFLVFREFKLDLNVPSIRENIVVDLRIVLSELSHNPDNWTDDLKRVVEENRGTENRTRTAAVVMFAALVKTNTCCKVALAYPQDKRIRSIALEVVTANMAALDRIVVGQPKSPFEPTPSTEFCSELIYVKRFMDSVIDF